MKKLLFLLFGFILGVSFLSTSSIVLAEWLWGEGDLGYDTDTTSNNTDTEELFKSAVSKDNDGIINSFLDIFRTNYYSWSSLENDGLVGYITVLLNIAMALASLIALIVLIKWFYVLYGAGDSSEAMEKWKENIVWATIALMVMGLSWYILSWIFGVLL